MSISAQMILSCRLFDGEDSDFRKFYVLYMLYAHVFETKL